MSKTSLPPILCGPLLRAVNENSITLWFVSQDESDWHPQLSVAVSEVQHQRLRVGKYAVINLLHVTLAERLNDGDYIHYDIVDEQGVGLAQHAPHLCYDGQSTPGFVYHKRVGRILHGSCRRPHHPAPDGLLRVDKLLADTIERPSERPSLLMHSGDQVYVDDVAGPMLVAIHQLVDQLGLYEEHLEQGAADNSKALREHTEHLYHRDQLLPDTEMNEAITEKFFGGVRKPIFTSSNAKNHLISLAEMLSMYFLVWSPELWKNLSLEPPASLSEEFKTSYAKEQQALTQFIEGLPQAARALANIPNYMIFDDHDITDDWNLSALWEETAYQHPYSKRIVGNALIGYLLCQASGNQPADTEHLLKQFHEITAQEGFYQQRQHDAFIDQLFDFEDWQYEIDLKPMVLVLDTRTRRWRSEIARSKPSGLMDWESLTEFQTKLLKQEAVIVVSPAPMFGVKLIEAIQEVFTFFGKPLLVDAENWMAHQGAAEVLLNIFAHRKTPDRFTILSGDVHYSFAYDVRLKHRKSGPHIWQITSSGIKNQFPDRLLEWLDRLNRWLYAPYSPLNWFTKRRRFRIFPRLPSERDAGERLWNHSGIGYVEFDQQGRPTVIKQLNADHGECEFQAARSQESPTQGSMI